MCKEVQNHFETLVFPQKSWTDIPRFQAGETGKQGLEKQATTSEAEPGFHFERRNFPRHDIKLIEIINNQLSNQLIPSSSPAFQRSHYFVTLSRLSISSWIGLSGPLSRCTSPVTHTLKLPSYKRSWLKIVVSELEWPTRNTPVHPAELGVHAETNCDLFYVLSIHRAYPLFKYQGESLN